MDQDTNSAAPPSTEEDILASLSPGPFGEPEPEVGASEEQAGEAEAQEGADGEAGAEEGEAAEGEEGQGSTFDLAKLQAIAEKRRAGRSTQQAAEPQEQATAQPLTAEALAKAMREGDSFREQIRQAVADGDLEKLAQLTADDPTKADPASIYERMTKRALDPTGTAAADKIAKLEAKIAELEKRDLPEGVLTEQKLAEREAAKARAESEAKFTSMIADAEKHPFLANIDEGLALKYAYDAQDLLVQMHEDTGQAFSLEDVARIAEDIASSKLQGLRAQNQGAAAGSKGGSEATKAASAATAGKRQAGGGIDNRAASTTAATMPDPDDDDAYERRSVSLALGSRG